jgi:Na+/H+ antiporter NhaA
MAVSTSAIMLASGTTGSASAIATAMKLAATLGAVGASFTAASLALAEACEHLQVAGELGVQLMTELGLTSKEEVVEKLALTDKEECGEPAEIAFDEDVSDAGSVESLD